MVLKTVITLVLVAPPALLALENVCIGRPIKAPRPALVRGWDIEANTHDGRLRFSFNINKDGTVDGNLIVMLNKKDVATIGGIGLGVSEGDEIALLPHVQGG